MGRIALVLALGLLAPVAGCRQILGLEELQGDAGAKCLGAASLAICLQTPPTGQMTIDTDVDTNGSICAPPPDGWSMQDQSDACFVYAGSITVPLNVVVRASGARPLVLVAADRIQVDGTLDAASHMAAVEPGAGVASGNCGTSGPLGPYCGGAGGSFASPGGNGGASGGGIGGRPADPVPRHDLLQAGCPGSPGQEPGSVTNLGGLGGGAIYLAAGSEVEVSGSINASGAGGQGGAHSSSSGGGGAGGGSGGMIVLSAPVVDVSLGLVFADGGGGGGGSNVSMAGDSGKEANGNSSCCAGGLLVIAGGAGAHDGQPPQSGATTGAAGIGGGGGGGSPGLVLVHSGSLRLGGRVSPAATVF